MVGDLPSDFGEASTNHPSAEQWTPTHATQHTATLTHMASCRPGRDRVCSGSRGADCGSHTLDAHGSATPNHGSDLYSC